MTNANRPVIIAGNWKMYKTIETALDFIQELIPLVKDAGPVYLAVPFTTIKPLADKAKDSNIRIGAQNMHDASEGAFTGEIAADMLKDAGAQFVVVGHSERRRLFKEDNAFINKKVKSALKNQLQLLLCIGESSEEREEGKTEAVLGTQLSECLAELLPEQIATLIIAYEPVWAIGTDHSATPEVAQETHLICRQFIAKTWGEPIADQVRILYGGAVKPANAKVLLEQPDIDGLLVGGASLTVDSFSKIVNYQNS
jgi:triosephosphate isomerase